MGRVVGILIHGAAGRSRWTCLALLLGLLTVLAAPPTRAGATAPAGVRREFFRLLHSGDSVYARKDGLNAIARSLAFYDRAQALALRSQDTLLLAEAVFAQGRVYDAWNQEPQKTVAAFQRAARLFRYLPGQRVRYLYVRHLVAHAYDKVPDSARAVAELRGLVRELRGAPDTLLRRVPFTVEMALIATQVHNYPLADSILRQLTRRAWIRNDSATYDYLTHYYLVRARLEVLHDRAARAPHLDSLRTAFGQVRNSFDRQFYAHNLASLYAAHYVRVGRSVLPYNYLRIAKDLDDSIAAGGDADQLRRELVASEERIAVHQRQAAATQRAARRLAAGILVGALAVISVLTFRLYRQRQASRGQAQALAVANHQIDDKVAQVELLNKEIQHRIKNNLHMIFSLLQMQERRSDNDEVIENLQAARLRVESIAALHNQLLLSPEGLDLSAYLKELISTVVSCLANDRQVVTHLRTEALHLPTNAYFALSLILNEWVTNSIKYADTPGDILEINVTVRTRPHEVCLEYADNGVYTPRPGIAAAHGRTTSPTLTSSGLGTQIIQLLTRQLGATLRTVDGYPYRYELCIPTAT